MMTGNQVKPAGQPPTSLQQRLAQHFQPDDLKSEPLRRLHADWFQLRVGCRIPDYRRFDICNFRYIVGFLSMVAVERDPWRFRYRVHASQAARNSGKDMTRRYVDDHPSELYRNDIQTFFIHAAQREEPTIDITHNVAIFGRMMHHEAVALPFGDADGVVTRLAVALSTRRILEK